MREADAVHAERMLREQLRQRGWTQAELCRRGKGDPEKVEIAWQRRSRRGRGRCRKDQTPIAAQQLDYGYDPGCNMTNRSVNGTATTYSVNDVNELTNDRVRPYYYDRNANRTNKYAPYQSTYAPRPLHTLRYKAS